MKKNFVLDTNVLLHSPEALFAFEDNNVVVPITVVEEIDNFKRDTTELGRSARQAARYLDALRRKGKIAEGVPLREGGVLRIAVTNRELPKEWRKSDSADNRILATAMDVAQDLPTEETTLVSKDITLRVRADALGLNAEDFDQNHIAQDELYSGLVTREVEGSLIDQLYEDGTLDSDALGEAVSPHCFLQLSASDSRQQALAKFCPFEDRIRPVDRQTRDMWGLLPRNREQKLAIAALADDRIKLVTLVGKAGTGKTLLAIAAGLQAVTEERSASKLIVARPVISLGKDLGYLPGTLEEKLQPWMQPIFDNVQFLMGLTGDQVRKGRGAHELIDQGLLEIEALSYIRGRSIPNQILLIDEAQNLTPHEMKTIITRAGEGTRVFLTGDPYQIDHPYLDFSNNGLIHAVKRFRESELAAHITLSRGERSELAEAAANLL